MAVSSPVSSVGTKEANSAIVSSNSSWGWPLALRTAVAMFSVTSLSVSLAAQGTALPQGVTEEMVEEGEQIFQGSGTCWVCHGKDAAGAQGIGANLTDDEWWHNDGSYEAIVRTIQEGVPGDKARNAHGTMMPPRGGSQISDEQLRAVAAYVWSLRRRSKEE